MALKTYIANPLYDSVFKFLLEDPRIDDASLNAILENDDTHLIFDRLLYAATDQEVRDQMDIEDEFVSEVEEKDTKIMRLEDAVSRKEEELQQKDEQLSQKDEQLSQKDEQLSQKDEQLSQKDEQLSQKDEQLAKSIQMLASAGVPEETISINLNISIEMVRDALK